jgi:uracil-DNA glycosylase
MSRASPRALLAHQAACRACHVCVDGGIIPEANPTFEGRWGAPFFLVGQAPGPTERISRRPFSGRAGKELDRWMLRAGFASPEEFRKLTYIAALMRCFPGRNSKGTGDLRPPQAAIANCAHWLDAELRMLEPRVLILVGQMAINRFLGPGSLEARVGRTFGTNPVMVPLPHPSGTSRWLNDPANRERLEAALALIADQRSRISDVPPHKLA